MFRTDEIARPRASARCSSSTSPASCQAWPGPSAPRTGSRCRTSGSRSPTSGSSARPAASDVTAEGEVPRLVEEGGIDPGGRSEPAVPNGPSDADLVRDGSVVIAAITSCTNTSNPAVMLGAGLLAKNAVERGLHAARLRQDVPRAGLARGHRLPRARRPARLPGALRFNLVGYGCTTCIGNSGPLPEVVAERIDAEDLTSRRCSAATATSRAASIRRSRQHISRLRRWWSLTRSRDTSTSTSPPTPSAPGRRQTRVPAATSGRARRGDRATVVAGHRQRLYTSEYARIFDGDEHWQQLPSPTGALFEWDPESTYVREPPYFVGMRRSRRHPRTSLERACWRCSATRSPPTTSRPRAASPGQVPAAEYLRAHGVEPRDFNTYGARRGNHEVMVRGTFANIRLRNQLAGGKEGGWTAHLPDGEADDHLRRLDALREEGVPLIVIAGREYGSGSSRDWAAKGPLLQACARSSRSLRAHPPQQPGRHGHPAAAVPRRRERRNAWSRRHRGVHDSRRRSCHAGFERSGERAQIDQSAIDFDTVCRLDSETDVEYLGNGGILPLVLRQLMGD